VDFPILDLMDQEGCCRRLDGLLHPDGCACPRCGAREGLNVHRRRLDSPVVDYRCKGCRRVFNMFTGTQWQGTHLTPVQILLILRGIAQGVPTAKLAREVGISRQHLLRLRHEIQARALAGADRSPLPDDQTEADEISKRGGKKGSRTPTRTTRHAAARTRRRATAPGRPTGRRSPGWSAGIAAVSGCEWDVGAARPNWLTPRSCPRPSRERR
jgi:transposase-like protein